MIKSEQPPPMKDGNTPSINNNNGSSQFSAATNSTSSSSSGQQTNNKTSSSNNNTPTSGNQANNNNSGRKRMIKVGSGAQRRNTTTPTNTNNNQQPSNNSTNNNILSSENNISVFPSSVQSNGSSNGSGSTGNVSTASATLMMMNSSVNSSYFMGSDHSESPISIPPTASNNSTNNNTTTSTSNNNNGMFQRVMTRHASEIMDISPKQRNLSKSMRVNPSSNTGSSKLSTVMSNTTPNSSSTMNTYNKHAIVLAQFCEQKGPSFVYCTQMINNIHDISHLEQFVFEQHKTTQTVSHHHHHQHHHHHTNITTHHQQQQPESSEENHLCHNNNHQSCTYSTTHSTSPSPPPSLSLNNLSTQSNNNMDMKNLENLQHPQTISSLASKDLMLHLKKYYPNLFAKEHHQQEENDHFNQLLMLSSIEQLTIDRENEQIFVSSHQESSKFSAHFKTLAIRSTSAEISVGQGREGPVLFGDEINGYNFAYIFKVKDSMARGFARWFAIVLMDTSLSMLTISWPFLNSGMGRIVKLIRARSQQVFLEEKEKQKRSGSSNALNEDGTNAEDHGYRFFHSGGPLSADVFRQKRSKGPMRDLHLLLNYPDFHSDLHTCFSGLLQSFYNKLSEIELSNNYQKLDMYNNYSIPGMMVACEMPRIRSFTSNTSSSINSFAGGESDNSTATMPINGCFNLLSDFSKILKKTLFTKVLTERNIFINILNGIEMADNDDANEEAYNQSEEMIKSLIYNTLIGNQLVVRSDSAHLRNEVCRLFTTLVPKECIKMVQDSDSYIFPYDANFLTVSKQVQVTEDTVDFRFVVLLDIEGNDDIVEEISIRTEQEYKETTLGKEIEKLFFQTIFAHIQQYSSSGSSGSSSMDYNTLYDIEQNILKSLIHEWTRKAKFFVHSNRRNNHISGDNLPIHIHENDNSVLRYFGSTVSLKKSFSHLNLSTNSTVQN